jgi:signal peptidase I
LSERLAIGATPRRRLPIKRAGIVLAVVVGLALLITRLVFFEVVRVRGHTMAPAVHDGDTLLIASLTTPARGDVVLLEAGDRTVLRRVIGLPGERISALDGGLVLNEVPLETAETGLYAYHGSRSSRTVRQRHAVERLPDGRAHRILGDHDGAAQPWRLDVPELEIGPGQLFVLCDNRRTCPLDELAGVVAADQVVGVVRALVGEGRARIGSEARYGILRSIASSAGESAAGSPGTSAAESTTESSGDETTASPRK